MTLHSSSLFYSTALSGLRASPAVRRAHARRLDFTVRAFAPERAPRPENVAGDFYVDETCIDCDTCRWMSSSYERVNGKTAVTRQPETPQQRERALHALLSCPTFSIHVQPKSLAKHELQRATEAFPLSIEGCDDCYHCGFHAESSFGAASYFIKRANGGNVLMDSPRWNPTLAKRLAAMGGVKYLVLSHQDDVADHQKWTEYFGCERVIHRTEANRRQGTDQAERKLEGSGPWLLDDDSDVQIIHTPGHTAGCITLLYTPDQALFTGDHLAWSGGLGRLGIMKGYNWYSVEKQVDSVRKLQQYEFLHILPGHGRPAHFVDIADQNHQMERLLQAEESS